MVALFVVVAAAAAAIDVVAGDIVPIGVVNARADRRIHGTHGHVGAETQPRPQVRNGQLKVP